MFDTKYRGHIQPLMSKIQFTLIMVVLITGNYICYSIIQFKEYWGNFTFGSSIVLTIIFTTTNIITWVENHNRHIE